MGLPMLALLCVLSIQLPASALQYSLATPTWETDYKSPRELWTGLRIAPYFNSSFASGAEIQQLKTDIVPIVVRWFERVLKVPRLNTSLKVPIPYCGQGTVPPVHQAVGVDADVVLYIVTAPFRFHTYDRFSYGSACLLSEIAPYRVLAGTVWVQMDWFNGLSRNKKVDLIAQHFAQALGFDSLLFQHFTKPGGNRYEEDELHATTMMAGALRHVLTLPTVVEKARMAFNCPSLTGVRLSGDETDDNRFNFYQDNYGSYKQNFTTYLTLWSARMMLNDFMSDLIVSDRAEYSSVTLAVFQDSGWYEVDWNYTSAPRFAYKRGCAFFDNRCLTGTTPNVSEFCSNSQNSCSSDFTSKGLCTLINYGTPVPDLFRYFSTYSGGNAKVDYCSIVEKGDSCLEGDAEITWEEKCSSCRCFSGGYQPTSSSATVRTTHCQRVTCDQGKTYVKIANETVECPIGGGAVSIPGFTGSLICPSVDRICKPPPCKNLCSGNGKCTNGDCLCNIGFYGDDCALTCHPSCLSCSAGSEVMCASCRAGAHLSSGQCLCSAQFSMNVKGECVSLTACHPTCLSCFDSTANGCRTCRSPATLSANSTCECPTTKTMNDLGNCVQCQSGCAKCVYPSLSTCVPSTRRLAAECAANQYLSATSNQCENCFLPCTSCSGTSILCLSCSSGYTLNGTVCECPAGSFVENGKCLPCHSNCLTCSGSEDWECTSCRSDSLLKSSPGFCMCRSSSSSDCFPCDPECSTCSEVDPFQCETCRENAALVTESKRCMCDDGFFLNQTTYRCDQCHASCDTCFGPTPDNCNSCIATYDYLDGHVCRCNARRYISLSDLQCKNCTAHCARCESLACSQCDNGFKVNSTGNCELMEGYYYDEEEGKAYECPTNCAHCNFTVKPKMECLNCKATFLMNSTSNSCYCPIGSAISNSMCQLCQDPFCATCASYLSYCYTCLDTFVKNTSSKCDCPSGKYEVNRTCQACAQNCSTCTGPDLANCASCQDGFYLDRQSELLCPPCHAWCRQCNGPNSDNCTGCWAYSSFEPGILGKCYCNFRVNETTCYYLGSRDLCDSRCHTCNGPSYRNCTSCDSLTGVLKQYNGYYGSGSVCECLSDQRESGTCWPCGYECESCNNNGTCSNCFWWTQMSKTSPGTCLCRNGNLKYYPNPDIFTCTYCNMKCLTCTGPNENQCTSCIPMADLQTDGTCKCRGIAAMAPDGTCFTRNFFCLDEYCDTCRGLAIWSYGEYRWRWMGVCNCPAQTSLGTGLYPDSMTGICHKCGPLCQNCARDTRMCNFCKPHSHLSYISALGAPGFCECDKGYFVSYEYEECLVCPPGCTACRSEIECTGCQYGYELSAAGGTTHCECYSAFCKCPVSFKAIPPFDNCEVQCHTGFMEKDRKCIATDDTKFVFTPVSIEAETVDRSGTLRATYGDPNINNFTQDTRSPIPIYKNGLLFKAKNSAYLTITGIDVDFILGPIHYIELWERGSSLFSIKRGGSNPTLNYNNNSISMKLLNKTTSKTFSFSSPNISAITWTLIRYEVQAYKYRLGTRIRMYSNNVQLFEQILLDYFYRDDAFDGLNTDITISTDVEMMLGDFVIANRLWAAELTPACGCSHCTIAGSCLTDCAAMEYLKDDNSCGQCDTSCSLGCVRGTDCILNIDPLCIEYSNFTGCSGCKDLTTLSDGVCTCTESSTFQENNTCTCDVHYKVEEDNCEFVPDSLCRNYTDPPTCPSCVLRAELVEDFCTCISHSTFSEESDSCECDPHYIYNNTHCIFDPLCDVSANEVCSKCLVRATYDGNLCQCVKNSTQSEELMSCQCNDEFKPFENICIPKIDLLCAEEVNGVCTQCKEMASRINGICKCTSATHFDKLTESCLCEDWSAVLDGNCVYSPDPLCAHLHADGSCSACKGLAFLGGDSCQCVTNSTVAVDGLSCLCNSGLKPYGNQCITADDPLCTSLDDYICKKCAPLSTLVGGLCKCIDYAYFYNGTCVCDPMYVEYQGRCIVSTDPLCAKLSAPGICGECKPQAIMRNGECTCVAHSSYLAANSTCTCDFHYAANGTSCDFYPDPLCKKVTQFQECLECKPLSILLRNTLCSCIDHASTWLQSNQCDCDYHYQVSWKGCEFDPDPLCSIYDSNGKCTECKPAAYYQNGGCTCGNNTFPAADRRSCGCLPGFKVYKTKCIPENDPLCTKLEQNQCKECSSLSSLVEGVCTCILHAQFTSTSCLCEPHYASFDGKCVYSTDPLCGELDNKGKCVGCKPQANLRGRECICVDHSTYFANNFTCGCSRRYLPSGQVCALDPDPLCVHYNANDDCTKCNDLSELNSDLCQCVERAHNTQPSTCVCDTHYLPHPSMKKCDFDPDPLCLNYASTCLLCKPHSTLKESYCRCEEDYALQASSSTCELCYTYLLPSDVEVEISADFSQVVVTFAGSVKSKVSCKAIFAGTAFAKFGSKATCQWNLDRTLFLIGLDSDATVVEEDFELDSSVIIQSQRPCGFRSPNFHKKAKYKGNKVPLTANLKVPPIVSLECSNAIILLDAKGTLGGMGAALRYKWSIVHSAIGSLYTEFNTYSSKNLISLSAKDLFSGTLQIIVTVKDRLGQEDSASDSIELTEMNNLVIGVDVGHLLNLTSDSQASARAIVDNSCGQSGQRVYKWSYEGSTPALPSTAIDPTNVLLASKIPSTLIIEKGGLTPGYSYLYKVKVTQGALSGSAQFTVKATASDLKVRLSRASGNHPIDVKFTLSAANSRDPDNSPGAISYMWKCIENYSECKDATGAPLLSNATSADIAIDSEKLRVGAVLNFTVTISKDSRVSSASAVFTIVESTGITLLLPPFYQKFVRHQYLSVVPRIDTKYQTFFKWEQVPEVTITPDSPADAPYLAFFAYRLPPGKQYNFEMTATTLVGTMKLQASFYVISEPEQGVTTVEPITGREVIDWFTVSTTGWIDPDANYPLTYQFCIQLSAEVCLSPPQLSSWRSTKLTAGTYSMTAKVYNSLGGLGYSTSPAVTVEDIPFYRHLVDISIQESFMSDIEDSEATLGMIAVYCQSISLDDQFFSFLTDTLTTYMNSLFEVDLQGFEAFLGTVESMTIQNASRTAANAEKLLTLTTRMMERYNETLSEAQLTAVISLAVTLSPNATDAAGELKKLALAQFYRSRLPSASPFTFIASSLQLSTLRQFTQSLSAKVLKSGSVSVSIPSQWLNNTNLTVSDVVDLQVTALPGNLSLIVKVEMMKSGVYVDYNVQLLLQPQSILLFNATALFNISLPYSGNVTEVECVGLDESGQWSPALCMVIGNKSGVITVSARSITAYTLRSITHIPEPVAEEPTSSSTAGEDDEKVRSINPIPSILAALLLAANLIGVVASKKLQPSPSAVYAEESTPFPNAKNEVSDADERITIKQYTTRGLVTPREQLNFPVSFCQYHAIIRAFHDRSMQSIAPLALLMMTDLLVLGLCYTFWSAGDESVSTATEVFGSYSGLDMAYVGTAVATGTGAYSLCVLLMKLKRVGVVLCEAAVVAEFAGVVVMNTFLAFGPGGRWGEGALWTALIQFVIVETVKTFLASAIRRHSTQSAAKVSVQISSET